ncbi:hypothetical protein BDW42DRAFT_185339 [Aspergillus taichungensis]|uniref:FHA domain-containing protein n=1 Tax=Aspergillus taichungensis TaxID=482145 RepID=A0A2J5HVY1_9EURO|nr:hypothetical protein BDW42DRAFT_185339 [Aspergillus taichungensis]
METPGNKAVLILYSAGVNDTYPYRNLIFTSRSPDIVVGRASNRQTKNLTPQLNNAFYESRVMSRNHATLRAGLDEKKIYIRDGGSMHGTWLNGEKVPGDKDTAIHDGDLVTFGAQVVRGTETFSPLEVRCKCDWLGSELVSCNLSDLEASDMMSRDSAFQRRQSDNTFVVPDDDDDDEVQTTHQNVSAFSPIDVNSEAGDSDSSSYSGGLSPHELESLVTSPWKNDSSSIVVGDNDEVMKGNSTNGQSIHADGAGIGNSELRPIDLDGDQPLATPRMTPPSAGVKDGEPPRPLAHQFAEFVDQASVIFDSDAENSESKSDLGEEVEDYSDDDSLSESSSGSDAEEPKMDHEPAKASSPQPGVWYPPLVGNPWRYEGKTHDANPASNDDRGQTMPAVKLNPIIGGFESSNTSGVPSGCKLAPFQPRLGHCFTNFAISSAPEDWSSQEDPRQPSVHGVTSLSPVRNLPLYHDGPFINAHVPNLEDVGDLDARESALYRNDDTSPHAENNVDLADVREKNSSARATNNTRVSISDIIEASSAAHDTIQNPPRKRKALDMEIDSLVCDMATGKHRASSAGPSLCAERPVTSTNDDSYLPDAQPQEGVPHLETRSEIIDGLASLNGTQTANSVSSPTLVPASGPDHERASKRPKTSPQTIRSHAASAAVGAIVGAVGMVAALAALPADYFQ